MLRSFMMFRVPLERAAAFMFLPVLVILSIHIHLGQCQLVVLSECTCPGRELRLECTVVGSGSTVWRGTAFDCQRTDNEIALRHTQFKSGMDHALGECNSGMIMGLYINRTSAGPNSKFTSQLVIHLPLLNATNSSLDGRTIECIYDNGLHETNVGTHQIEYTRAAPPPDNVHLAQVSKNTLTFQWEPGICPSSTGYKVNATNCGVCPNTTPSTSLTCVVSSVFAARKKMASCSLSIETVVCGIDTGNSSTVTALLKAPDPPNISRVLPYYSASSKELIRIDVDVDVKSDRTEKFNISEGIDGSVNTYTFNIQFLDSDLDCSTSSLATVPVSSCVDHTCKITLDLANLTCYTSLSQAEMAIYASNVLTDGQPSTTLLNTSNSVFFVEFEPLSHTFSCQFIGHYGIKSCEITIYGATDPTDEICSLKDQVTYTQMNSSDDFVLDTVTVPVHIAQTDHESMRLCFRAVGTTSMFTVGVEGTFITGILPKSNMNPALTLAVSLLCATIILILLASIAILSVILIRKCHHQSQHDHEQELSQPQQQPITDHQMIYSEVNPLHVNGNNTLFMLEDDDKVEYAELNHQLHCHASNPTKTCAAESINFEATNDSLTVTLDSLLIQLRSQVTSIWYKFGLALGISKDTLDGYVGYPDEECIVEVLDYWMRNHKSKPTWRDVAKSLKDVGLYQLADGILNVYKTGKLPIEVDMEAIPQDLLESELDIESQSTLDSPPPLPPKYY